MKYGYNGISQFSSVRNTDASSTLDKLGFKSEGTNLNLRYQNNSILMDSLFGVRYNLSQQPVQKFGCKEIATKMESHFQKTNMPYQSPFCQQNLIKILPLRI